MILNWSKRSKNGFEIPKLIQKAQIKDKIPNVGFSKRFQVKLFLLVWRLYTAIFGSLFYLHVIIMRTLRVFWTTDFQSCFLLESLVSKVGIFKVCSSKGKVPISQKAGSCFHHPFFSLYWLCNQMEFDGKIWTFSNKNDQVGITVSKYRLNLKL